MFPEDKEYLPACYGTKEYSESHTSCKSCKFRSKCKNVKPKKFKLKRGNKYEYKL